MPKNPKPKPEQVTNIPGEKLVAECAHCKHVWLETIKLPIAASAFSARLYAINVCPKCGQSGAYMLLGDRYKEELAKLEPAKFRAEAIAKADLVVDPHDDGTEAVAVAETQRDADHKYYMGELERLLESSKNKGGENA